MAHLVKELSGLDELLEAQVRVGMDRCDVVEAMLISWLDRISALQRIDSAVSLQLTASLASSPFAPEQTKQLARAILDIGSGSKMKKSTSRGRANQKCARLENMIPEKIWAKLREAKISQNTRLSLLATVCSSIKLVNPDQPTLYRGVAIDA